MRAPKVMLSDFMGMFCFSNILTEIPVKPAWRFLAVGRWLKVGGVYRFSHLQKGFVGGGKDSQLHLVTLQ